MNQSAEPLRAALIGFGLAGSVFHGPLIAGTAGITLSTVVTRDPARAATARRQYPGISVEADPGRVWDRADEHDLVIVATRNDSHTALARCAIDAGLPVVVDKPLAPSAEEARDLIGHAEQRGVGLTVFHNRRWDSDQLTLRRLIRDGLLGDVHRYESRFERWRPELRDDAWRETAAPGEGGGVLFDLGIHLVDQALQLFGPVRRVHGDVSHRRGGPADDDAFVSLEHVSGVNSQLWASSVAAAPGPRLRVLGSRAAFVVEALDGQEEALASGLRPGGGADWGVEPAERWGQLVRGDDSEPVRSENGAWPRFYEELVGSVKGEHSMPVDPRDALAILEIFEHVRAGGS